MDKKNALRGDGVPLMDNDVLMLEELVRTQRELIIEQRLLLSLLVDGGELVGVVEVVPEDSGEGL